MHKKKKFKPHHSHFNCFVYILITLHPETRTMPQHSVPGHDSKDNEQLSNSNERTTKDLSKKILFYIREFEKNITKKINVQRGNTSRILILTYYVETFLQVIPHYYKNICIIYPRMNYPVFSDLKSPSKCCM